MASSKRLDLPAISPALHSWDARTALPSTTALARAMDAAARSSSNALRRRRSCSYSVRSAMCVQI